MPASYSPGDMWRTKRELRQEELTPGQVKQIVGAMDRFARYSPTSKMSEDEAHDLFNQFVALGTAAGVICSGAPYAADMLDNPSDAHFKENAALYEQIMSQYDLPADLPYQMIPYLILVNNVMEHNAEQAELQAAQFTPSTSGIESDDMNYKVIDASVTGTKKTVVSSTLAAAILKAATSTSGCVDDIPGGVSEPQNRINIFVYQDGFKEEGTPQDEIKRFYAWAESGGEEKSGGPISLEPVIKYTVEIEDLDIENIGPEEVQTAIKSGDITLYDSDNKPVDPNTLPDNIGDYIVKDNNNNPITDLTKFLDIEPTGKNEYKINNLAREMPDPDGKHIWRVSHERGNKYDGDTKFNDNIFKIGDHDDMYGGFTRGEDGKVYGVIIADKDTFDLYGNSFGAGAAGENTRSIHISKCEDLGNGLYVYKRDLSGISEGVGVFSPFPQSEKISIARKNGGFAQFSLLKEKL